MGNVSAENFGLFQADGQVKKTLEHPLARHLQALNRIRQAVPALRKGQYSTEGCSSNGGRAWKKGSWRIMENGRQEPILHLIAPLIAG